MEAHLRGSTNPRRAQLRAGLAVALAAALLAVEIGAPRAASAEPPLQTVTLAATDGYDAKNQKTLVQDGKLYLVQRSDNDWFQVEAGHWLSLQFAGIPTGATVESATVRVEHHEEAQFPSAFQFPGGGLSWEVGGGSLTSPRTAASFAPPVIINKENEQTVTWDVSGAIDTPAEVNDLKFVVRNSAANGKKTLVDRAELVVSYREVPVAPTITSTPRTTGTVEQAYTYQAQASGTPPLTWTLVNGPAGMKIDSNGLVSWAPTATGSVPVTIRATNDAGFAEQSYTIDVVQTAPRTLTLAPTDGYDAKNSKTLVQDGKLSVVQASDNNWFQVEGGQRLNLQFARTTPADATIHSVRVRVEHYEEQLFPAGALRFEVGGGSLTSPTTAASFAPPVLIDKENEQTVAWDVSGAIDTPAEVNDLKLVVRNNATNGKKANVDRAYVEVSYSPKPVAPMISSTPPTSAYVNTQYRYQAQATGEPGPRWSLVSSPPGMTVDSSSGVVSWTPTQSGSFPVTLRATNATGFDEQRYTITVASTPPDGMVLAAGDIADSGTGDETTAAILGANPTARVLTLGDNVYPNGTLAEFNAYYAPSWGQHKSRTHPAPGNHDYTFAGAPGYFGYFGAAAGDPSRGYYSFDVGPWHLISLNSEQGFGATGAQVTWLKNDLAATTASCVLAFWHKPRFTAGNYSDFAEFAPFWDALYAANAEIVLNGHDHNYQRYQPLNPSGAVDTARGIREFVVGTGGRSHYALRADTRRAAANDDTYGVLKLTLHPSSYDWQFLPEAGRAYADSGSGSCH